MARSGSYVDVNGLGRLRRDLRRVGDDLGDLKDANKRAGTIVAAEAGRRAPRGKTGRLSGSGRASRAVGRVSVLFGGASVPYAGPVHWGWPAHGIEANPFVPDAAQATEPAWLPAYQTDLEHLAARLDGHRY